MKNLIVLTIAITAMNAVACARTSSTVPDSLEAVIEQNPESDEISKDFAVERWVKVDASPECVYDTITDIDHWSKWDPAIDETRWVKGKEFKVGNVFYQRLGDIEFHGRIIKAERGKIIRWYGQNPDGTGVIGAHSFLIIPAENGGAYVINREAFDAWYVRPVGWVTDLGIGDQFETAMQGLAKFAPENCKAQELVSRN